MSRLSKVANRQNSQIFPLRWMAEGPEVALSYRQGGVWQSQTYDDLCQDAACVAGQLAGLSSADHPLIGIGVKSAIDVCRIFYGALWLGLPVLPFDPELSPEKRNGLLSLAECRQLVSGESLQQLPIGISMQSVPHLRRGTKLPEVAQGAWQLDQLQLVVATSGSTGAPKGVMLSSGNLWSNAKASNQCLGYISGDRWLNVLPLRHIGGISILYRSLQAGAEMVLLERFDTDSVLNTLVEKEISHISLVPTMLQRLLDAWGDQPPPDALRVVLVGGATLDSQLAERAQTAGWPVWATYGMSETASQVACAPVNSAVGVGLPLDDVSLRATVQGLIEVSGPSVMLGYLEQGLPIGIGLNDGWFTTGDIGYVAQDGSLIVEGRADGMVVSGGVNVYPSAVERQLIQCPGIDQVAVVGVPDGDFGSVLHAVYSGTESKDLVLGWIKQNLSPAERPKLIKQVASLPENEMGKKDRSKLLELIG